MNINELLQIVHIEELDQPVLYGEGTREMDSVVLERDGATWKVYVSNERGGAVDSTLQTFDNQSDALEQVLTKLRQVKKARLAIESLMKKRRKPSVPTHVQEVNGAIRNVFLDNSRSYPDKIRHTLHQMNGSSFWGYSLWGGSKGTDLFKDESSPDEYIQCFGSAQAMTVRVRTLDPDDDTIAYQFVIGKPGPYKGEPTKVLSWDEGHQGTKVYADELFTSDEAAVILYTYFETNGVTRFYNLREIEVTENIGTAPETYSVSSNEVKAQRLNEAIVAYLGKGVSSFPRYREEAVREFAAENEAEELLSRVKEIVTGCMSVEIDWSTHTLTEASDEVRRVMAAQYPQLNNEALDALCWAFAYSNK